MLMLLIVSNLVKMFVSFTVTTHRAILLTDSSVSFLYIVCQEGFDVPKGWRPDLGIGSPCLIFSILIRL